MQRATLSSYYHVNNIILSKNDDGNTILIVPDLTLWNSILDEKDIEVKELDISVPEEAENLQWFRYGEDLGDGWYDIDVSEELFTGKIFQIKVKDLEYSIPINRELMPMKLKKAEYVNVSYRVFGKPLVLAIKKRFDFPVEDTGFTMIRLFQVI